MKKFICTLLISAFVIMPGSTLLASEPISFFEAMGNLSKVEDYKLIQSIYGNMEFEEGGDHIKAEYRVSFNSVIDGGNRMDNFSRVNAYLKLSNFNEVNDATPFKEMIVQANGEIISQGQNNLYFKLNNFNINLKEPVSFAVVDIENVKNMIDLYRGTWFHTTANEFLTENADINGGEKVNLDEYKMLEEQLKENPKEAFLKLSELVLQDSGTGLSEKEMGNVLEGIKVALETELFTQRDIVAGKNSGFKFFNLNKGAIIGLLNKFAQMIGQEMSTGDSTMIRAGLGKVSLSGIYRINDTHSLIDNLLIRFRLKDIGVLKNLEVNYRYKLSDIGKENSIKAPTNYEDWVAPFSSLNDESDYDFSEDDWMMEEDF